MFDAGPVDLLRTLYKPREALARGFVHYDWKWKNDTNDIVADLAALAGTPANFSLLSAAGEQLTFEVRQNGHTTKEERVPTAAGDLDALAERMNRWLDELGAPRRLWTWDTGGDSLAFLGRATWEVEAMAVAGVPIDGLVPHEARGRVVGPLNVTPITGTGLFRFMTTIQFINNLTGASWSRAGDKLRWSFSSSLPKPPARFLSRREYTAPCSLLPAQASRRTLGSRGCRGRAPARVHVRDRVRVRPSRVARFTS